jgi:hypothetical protein
MLAQCGESTTQTSLSPGGMAILLCGGDKSGLWSAWYAEAIPAADRLYDEHLQTLVILR